MLLAKLDEGYDLVSGWRQKRQDASCCPGYFLLKLPTG